MRCTLEWLWLEGEKKKKRKRRERREWEGKREREEKEKKERVRNKERKERERSMHEASAISFSDEKQAVINLGKTNGWYIFLSRYPCLQNKLRKRYFLFFLKMYEITFYFRFSAWVEFHIHQICVHTREHKSWQASLYGKNAKFRFSACILLGPILIQGKYTKNIVQF